MQKKPHGGRTPINDAIPQTDNARRLQALGEVLWGKDKWQNEAARALQVNSGLINYYVRRGGDPGDERVARMRQIMREHINDCVKSLERN